MYIRTYVCKFTTYANNISLLHMLYSQHNDDKGVNFE